MIWYCAFALFLSSFVVHSQDISDCVDKRTLCPFWAQIGQCSSNTQWMTENCNAACNNTCNPKKILFETCVDGLEDCNGWFIGGFCKTNPYYMIWKCPKSCGFCVKPKPEGIEYPAELKALANGVAILISSNETQKNGSEPNTKPEDNSSSNKEKKIAFDKDSTPNQANQFANDTRSQQNASKSPKIKVTTKPVTATAKPISKVANPVSGKGNLRIELVGESKNNSNFNHPRVLTKFNPGLTNSKHSGDSDVENSTEEQSSTTESPENLDVTDITTVEETTDETTTPATPITELATDGISTDPTVSPTGTDTTDESSTSECPQDAVCPLIDIQETNQPFTSDPVGTSGNNANTQVGVTVTTDNSNSETPETTTGDFKVDLEGSTTIATSDTTNELQSFPRKKLGGTKTKITKGPKTTTKRSKITKSTGRPSTATRNTDSVTKGPRVSFKTKGPRVISKKVAENSGSAPATPKVEAPNGYGPVNIDTTAKPTTQKVPSSGYVTVVTTSTASTRSTPTTGQSYIRPDTSTSGYVGTPTVPITESTTSLPPVYTIPTTTSTQATTPTTIAPTTAPVVTTPITIAPTTTSTVYVTTSETAPPVQTSVGGYGSIADTTVTQTTPSTTSTTVTTTPSTPYQPETTTAPSTTSTPTHCAPTEKTENLATTSTAIPQSYPVISTTASSIPSGYNPPPPDSTTTQKPNSYGKKEKKIANIGGKRKVTKLGTVVNHTVAPGNGTKVNKVLVKVPHVVKKDFGNQPAINAKEEPKQAENPPAPDRAA